MELTARVYMKTSKDGIEYVRIIAPKELQAHLAKPAVWRSLKTSDRNEALEEAAICIVAVRNLMQDFANEFFADCLPSILVSNEISDGNVKNMVGNFENELVDKIFNDLKKSFTNKTISIKCLNDSQSEIQQCLAVPISKRKKLFLKLRREKLSRLKKRR